MPPLSKKRFVKSQTSSFKSPLLNKENIEKVLGVTTNSTKPQKSFKVKSTKTLTISSETKKKNNEKKEKSIEPSFEECISDSQHSDLSYRMNEPAIKNAYLQFVKNLHEPDNDMTCSTPVIDGGNESEDLFTSSHETKVISRKTDSLRDSGLPPSEASSQIDQVNFMKNFKELTKKKTKTVGKHSEQFIAEKIPEQKTDNVLKNGKSKKTPTKQDGGSNEKSLIEKMLLIQESRNVGLYCFCDSCDKARYLPDVTDPLDLPEKWYCHMNLDPKRNKCSDPEEAIQDEEFLIENLYNAGSIVWAKLDGYPWWPALVEDDPDSENYYYLEEEHGLTPTYYHVTFFDSYEVTRAWIRPKFLRPFKINKTNPEFAVPTLKKFKARVEFAFKQAEDALELTLIDRLKKYSFIQRYTKPLLPKKTNAKVGKVARKKKEKSVFGQKNRRIGKLVSSGDGDSNISFIMNSIDWQDDNINLNILEKFA